MEIIVFFSLFLLVCSVSTHQTETGNEIADQQILLQKPSPQDIHAVLQELTILLSEQKTEIRSLKQENQKYVSNLEQQRSELKKQMTETDKQKQQLQEQEAKLTEVERLKTELENQKTETEQLKQQLQVKQVAFSASLLDRGHGFTGPFNTQPILIFRRVVTNIGNAYNPQTGIFTAPVRGVYHFEWHIFGYGDIQTGAVLFRNGQHIYLAWEHQSGGYMNFSNGASLLLQVGDQVFLRLWAHSRIYDSQNHHTTFSGHLIFTM